MFSPLNKKNLSLKRRKYYKRFFILVDKNFLMLNYYKFYGNSLLVMKRNILNIKYFKYLIVIKNINIVTSYKFRYLPYKNVSLKKKILLDFLSIYNMIYYYTVIEFFYFAKLVKRKRSINFLIFTFKKNKLYINLLNSLKKTFLFLSPGMFIKFFEKKKSFKKNKIIKILLAKYLRKVFILTKVNNFIFFIKNTPVFLLEILNFLNQPIIHKFLNPYTDKMVDEESSKVFLLKVVNIVFLQNKTFSINKIKKRGRIKRKIIRKLVMENKLID